MKCFLCNKSFKENDIYFRHLKSYHFLKHGDTYRCCGTIYKNGSNFKRHVRVKHSTITKTNTAKCNIVSNLEQHLLNNNEKTITPNEYVREENIDSDNINVENVDVEILTTNFVNFQTEMYSNHNFCRSDVENINKKLISLIIEPLLHLFGIVCAKNDPILDHKIFNFTEKCKKIYHSLKTEHLITKKLMEENLMEYLIEEVVASSGELTHTRGKLNFSQIDTKIAYMPMKFVFQKILERQDSLLKIISSMSSSSKSASSINMFNGKLWQKKIEMYPNRLLIPYVLYCDDLEINNPLGSHSSNLVCNFYASFPGLPDDTKLQNVYFIAAINSNDLKFIGKPRCLKPIVDQMVSLELEGISIKLSNGEIYHPHLIPILILGDNLGLNSLLGFSKSFNSTFCRLCIMSKKDSQNTVSEQPNLRRTYENYETQILQKNPSETGIVEKCVFHKIPSFHVADNLSVDAMHDVMEGICHYDICNALLYFIEEKKYFTLQTLNKRKKQFDYGELEIGNICQDISLNHIKKKHLRMSASEMLTFILYFPIMVGDLVPTDDRVWEFILILIEIIDTILLFELSAFDINAFKMNVEKHNQMYLNIFNDTLKPKFHILTHYPEVMESCGPVRKFWSFHFEAKHRSFKLYMHSVTSRRNVSVTIAKKYQFYFAHLLLESSTYSNEKYICLEKDRSDSSSINIASQILEISVHDLRVYDKLIYNNLLFKNGFYVCIRSSDYTFYKISNIIICENNIYLCVQKIHSITYLKHYTAFEINPDDVSDFEVLDIDTINIPPTTIIGTARGKFMIRLKEI